MNMIKNFSIGVRVFSLLGFMILFLAGVVIAFLAEMREITTLGVGETQRIMLSDQKEKLQVATKSMAISLGEAIKGLSDEQAVEAIRKAIDTIRFEEDKSGYFFVYKGTVNVALPTKKESHGKDLGDLADKNGVYFVRELARRADGGGGFIEYIFPKPGKGDQPKLGYAEMIPGTKYWIGTGVYIDNIEDAKTGIKTAIEGVVRSMTGKILAVMAAVFVLVILPVSWILIQSVVRPIKAATEAASRVAAGNLDVALGDEGKSEVGVLNRALEHMVDTLKGNIAEINAKTRFAEEKASASEVATRDAEEARARAEHAKAEGMLHAAQSLEKVAEKISAAAGEISTQADEIRSGSELQRDRIQSTATAMEEMTATIMEVAKNAGSAADEGRTTRDRAVNGAQVVENAIGAIASTEVKAKSLKATMEQLDEKARAIGNVITVIDDIADQTNLLALNAAIEAARAGEAGRGFAVVADEVRKLAEKTMTATKEVAESIKGIQSVAAENVLAMDAAVVDLSKASELSDQSGKVLSEIVAGAEKAAEQIRSIATAAEEQSATTEEINRSVDEVNSLAQNAAKSVHETTLSLQELSKQTMALIDLINGLKSEAGQ
jgi:methyl-accepting chemotaxis protein